MPSRSRIAKTLADALVSQGYEDVTPEITRKIIDAWCDGARGLLLPHSLLGAWVGHHLNEMESEVPGSISGLKKR